jgi:hypothetical protein
MGIVNIYFYTPGLGMYIGMYIRMYIRMYIKASDYLYPHLF